MDRKRERDLLVPFQLKYALRAFVCALKLISGIFTVPVPLKPSLFGYAPFVKKGANKQKGDPT